ncbi:hypothetical protein SCLCIDRAFT_572442 [Scleroderma citrinum Foug A]|uniref:Uncharacterized protein n=1 Tax=Scleroderma citrinum Foug A TaxID=1036808 RepID=A0A0C3D755_9AGAM|nr:hypothetical protein SCLCIDRAFT_572442 [Scleroderma citrinum Foug A]
MYDVIGFVCSTLSVTRLHTGLSGRAEGCHVIQSDARCMPCARFCLKQLCQKWKRTPCPVLAGCKIQTIGLLLSPSSDIRTVSVPTGFWHVDVLKRTRYIIRIPSLPKHRDILFASTIISSHDCKAFQCSDLSDLMQVFS